MIDTVVAIMPLKHTSFTEGYTTCNSRGEIVHLSYDEAHIAGAFDATTLLVKSLSNGELLVSGSFIKFLQGHNIFGTDNMVALCNAIFKRLAAYLGVKPTEENLNAWRQGDFHLRHVDIAASFELDSQEDVHLALREIALVWAERGEYSSQFGKYETVYDNPTSKWRVCKFYNKDIELKAKGHGLPEPMPMRDELLAYASCLLRFEIGLKSSLLSRYGLNQAKNWQRGVVEKFLNKKLTSYRFDAGIRRAVPLELQADLRPHLIAALALWAEGKDLRKIYGKDTFRRYRKQLEAVGVDISRRPSKKNDTVVPLANLLSEDRLITYPEWAEETEILFLPSKKSKTPE